MMREGLLVKGGIEGKVLWEGVKPWLPRVDVREPGVYSVYIPF